MKRIISLILLFIMIFTFVSCDWKYTESGTTQDTNRTQAVANNLQANQPTPTDINYSLERYNLIRRAYWVNGQREKAINLPCELVKPVGYVTLFIGNSIVGSFTVDGKVTSLNSYLTPDSEFYEYISGSSSSHTNKWLADIDGSYGENDKGIFFFTTDGKYVEWTGTYLYTDIPMKINNPVIEFEGVNN